MSAVCSPHRNDATERMDVKRRLFKVSGMKLRKRRESTVELARNPQDLLLLGCQSELDRHLNLPCSRG